MQPHSNTLKTTLNTFGSHPQHSSIVVVSSAQANNTHIFIRKCKSLVLNNYSNWAELVTSKHWIMPHLTDNNTLNATTADNDGYCTSPSSALSYSTKIAQPDLHTYPRTHPLPWLLRFTWLIKSVSVAVLLVQGFEVFCPWAVRVPHDMSLFTFSSFYV